MLELLAVLIIHSAPFDELVAQAPGATQNNQDFSLKGGKTIVVQQIQFVGNSAISTEQLQKLTNLYLNRPLSEIEITEIQNRVTLLYKSKGYDEVKVSVPSKQGAGVLTIAIQEGKKSSNGLSSFRSK